MEASQLLDGGSVWGECWKGVDGESLAGKAGSRDSSLMEVGTPFARWAVPCLGEAKGQTCQEVASDGF